MAFLVRSSKLSEVVINNQERNKHDTNKISHRHSTAARLHLLSTLSLTTEPNIFPCFSGFSILALKITRRSFKYLHGLTSYFRRSLNSLAIICTTSGGMIRSGEIKDCLGKETRILCRWCGWFCEISLRRMTSYWFANEYVVFKGS